MSVAFQAHQRLCYSRGPEHISLTSKRRQDVQFCALSNLAGAARGRPGDDRPVQKVRDGPILLKSPPFPLKQKTQSGRVALDGSPPLFDIARRGCCLDRCSIPDSQRVRRRGRRLSFRRTGQCRHCHKRRIDRRRSRPTVRRRIGTPPQSRAARTEGFDHFARTQSRHFALGSVTLNGRRDIILDFQSTLKRQSEFVSRSFGPLAINDLPIIGVLRNGLRRILDHPRFDRVWLTRPQEIAAHWESLLANTMPDRK